MAEKDNMKVNTSPVADVETGTAEDVEAIMKKYDRESNTRIWEGTPKQVIRFLLAAFSVLMLYMNLFANWDERVRRSLFVGFVIILSSNFFFASVSHRCSIFSYISGSITFKYNIRFSFSFSFNL